VPPKVPPSVGDQNRHRLTNPVTCPCRSTSLLGGVAHAPGAAACDPDPAPLDLTRASDKGENGLISER
jgi:hypothetical protein